MTNRHCELRNYYNGKVHQCSIRRSCDDCYRETVSQRDVILWSGHDWVVLWLHQIPGHLTGVFTPNIISLTTIVTPVPRRETGFVGLWSRDRRVWTVFGYRHVNTVSQSQSHSNISSKMLQKQNFKPLGHYTCMQCGTSYFTNTPRKHTVTYHFSDLQEVYSGNRQIDTKCQLQYLQPPQISTSGKCHCVIIHQTTKATEYIG